MRVSKVRHQLSVGYRIRLVAVFFFKQKTAYEMRISDWCSDVCSSDLAARAARSPPRAPAVTQRHADGLPIELHVVSRRPVASSGVHPLLPGSLPFRRVEGSIGLSEAKNLGKNNQ